MIESLQQTARMIETFCFFCVVGSIVREGQAGEQQL
jgi:hypothetical protein